MKKLLALLAVMSLAVAANAGMIIPKIGIDFQGGVNLKVANVSPAAYAPYMDDMSNNANAGFDIGVEYLQQLKSDTDFCYGAGFEYLFARTLNVSGSSPNFSYLPIYLTGQYNVNNNSEYKPYVKLNLGWNLSYTGNGDMTMNNSSLTGGMYWAFGVGAKVYKDTVIAELMYSIYAGKHTGYTTGLPLGTLTFDSNDTYSVLGLKVGYCFDLACCKK